MTSFQWIDASGVTLILDTSDQIQVEAGELAAKIDRLFREVDMLAGDAKDRKRREIHTAAARLDQLKADAKRWNDYIELEARERARGLANDIRTINRNAKLLRLVVDLHDEFEMVSANNPSRLEGEPSHIQQRASASATTNEARDIGPTFVTAFKRLQLDPLFYRPESDEGGWFEWIDGDGVLCRLASPLAVEREVDEIVGTLFGMIPRLETDLPHLETVEILQSVDDLWNRLAVLRVNLESFQQESSTRDDEEWERAKREWQRTR